MENKFEEYRNWIKGLDSNLISTEVRNLEFLVSEDFSKSVKEIANKKLKIIRDERNTNL